MTPFMVAVQTLLEGDAAPRPATEPATVAPVATAAGAHVQLRSLAEQLVCEANAVLAPLHQAISLIDEARPGALAFTLGFRDRTVRVETVVAGSTGTARLVCAGGGGDLRPGAGRRLTGEDEMATLLLGLLADPTAGWAHDDDP